jgi:tellurite methyltransferase
VQEKNYNYDLDKLIDFWNSYYESRTDLLPNSNFSHFVLKYTQENQTLIDIGCGDGRDSVFFSANNIFTTGVDISSSAIKKNKRLENNYLKFNTLNIDKIQELHKEYDYAYCRFLFHAIDEQTENKLLMWMKVNISKKIFVETRIKAPAIADIEQTHYRRYFSQSSFVKKIKDNGLNITYSKTSNEFSKYKTIYNVNDLKDNPLLLRLIIEI